VNFKTNDYKKEQATRISPKFNVGWNEAKVEAIESVEAKNGSGKQQLRIKVYGPPVTIEGFKPFKKSNGSEYQGQCGIVQTIYFDLNNDEQFGNIVTRIINPLAKASGVQEKLDAATSEGITTFDEFVKVLNAVLVGDDLPYVYMNFSGQEYVKPGSAYPGYTLNFRNIVSLDADRSKYTEGVMKHVQVETASSQEEGSLY